MRATEFSRDLGEKERGKNDGGDKRNKGVIFPATRPHLRIHSLDFTLINHTFAALSKTDSQGLIYGNTAGTSLCKQAFDDD